MAVGVLTKGELQQATTRWAQGGVAAVLGGDPDSTDLHLADTLAAGAGLCDVDAVRVLVDEGPARVHELIALGAAFDRDTEGRLLLAREGGHSLPRVVHAGGAATGAEIERTLVDAVRADGRGGATRARSPSTSSSRAAAAAACSPLDAGGSRREVRAANVLARHRRVRAALRRHDEPARGHGRRRGHGACGPAWPSPTSSSSSSTRPRCTTRRCRARSCPRRSAATARCLRDAEGERFVDELLPRDQREPGDHRPHARAGRRPPLARRHRPRALRRAVPDDHRRARRRSASTRPRTGSRSHRPRTTAAAAWSPTSTAPRRCPGSGWRGRRPATACTAPTGWRRTRCSTAWSSGRGVVEAIDRGVDGPAPTGAMRSRARRRRDRRAGPLVVPPAGGGVLPDRDALQRTMTDATPACCARPSRSERAAAACAGAVEGDDPAAWELRNLATVGRALSAAALAREESRGAHTRTGPPGPA